MRQIFWIYFRSFRFWNAEDGSPRARAERRAANRFAPASVLVMWGRCGLVVVMAVVEDLANAATCAFGDFACALGSADAYVLSGDACTLAYVTGGVDRVESDEVASSFADALGCGSGSFGGVLADVAGSAADVTAGAAGLRLGRRLSLGGGLRWGGCGLAGLRANALAADGEG
jgi:hypothetical protein